jgi:hypothetical protein
MKKHLLIVTTFLIFIQVSFFQPSSAAPYNNSWQIQQQAAQRAAQAQRDAQRAAETARRNAQRAAEQARRNAQNAANQAKNNALRAAEQSRKNAQNIANQNQKNAQRAANQNQKAINDQRLLNSRQQEKSAQDLQKQRAMDRAIQKNIQNQKQKISNDNQLKIKNKLSKLKRIKQLKARNQKNKKIADKKTKEKKNNELTIRQSLNQNTANEIAKLRQIQKNQSTSSIKLLNKKISRKATKYSPINPGPLASDVVKTFRSATYTQRALPKDTLLYRVISKNGKPDGSYWTSVKPKGPLQSVINSALDQNWGNKATRIVTARVPAGTKIYEGVAAAQRGLVGGGNQVYIPKINPNWIQ